jgi:hypothetical protein
MLFRVSSDCGRTDVHNLGLPSFQALEAYNTSSYTSSGFIDTWTVKRP